MPNKSLLLDCSAASTLLQFAKILLGQLGPVGVVFHSVYKADALLCLGRQSCPQFPVLSCECAVHHSGGHPNQLPKCFPTNLWLGLVHPVARVTPLELRPQAKTKFKQNLNHDF
eukprot:6461751-Amphidinium_carterae.1